MALIRGEHSFEHDGQRYNMVLDANAFCEIEDVLGLNLQEFLIEMQQRPGMRIMRATLYGCLFEKHAFTLQECGNLLAKIGLEKLSEEITLLVKAALPEAEPGEAPPPVGNRQQRRKVSRGTGKKPSNSGAKRATTR